MQFLSYIISAEGIQMEVEKVEAVKFWPVPATIKELQCFLRFANFYRCFIKIYSQVTAPLTSLLKNKPKSLSWSPQAIHAFNALKEAFTSAPLVCHPDTEKPFTAEVDASTSDVGAVLLQQQGNPACLHPYLFHKETHSAGAEL